ncbi:MAG: OmpA family protein [Chitinophagales bacterium]
MKNTFLLAGSILLCLTAFTAKTQVNDPNQVAKDAGTNRANSDMDNAADKGINKAEQGIGNLFKKKNKDKKPDANGSATPNNGANASSAHNQDGSGGQSIKSYQNYDFVPGDKIIFEDHFVEDKDGEFPAHWNLEKGQAVINSLNGTKTFYFTDGNYCVVAPLVKSKSYLGNQFTVEYDNYNPDNAAYGVMTFFRDAEGNDLATVQVTPDEANCGYTESRSLSANLPAEIKDENYKNRWHHIAIVYNNKQIKVYVDQFRVLTVPNGDFIPASLGFEGIGDQNNPIIIKNVRVASGGSMNMLGHKFTDAKIITHGINFDVDKAVIRPESMGTLNMIVQILKDNPDIKFEIDGHTDNSGVSVHNLSLSQQRADAVKAQLVSMGVDAARLNTKGFGDTKPIADNSTLEGKANNRRVEFVKM